MKFLLLLSLTSLMFACSPIVEYTITGEADPKFEGKEIYLQNVSSDRAIDTTVVKDGKFTFSGKFNGEAENIMAIGHVKIEKSTVVVILEEGNITVNITPQSSEVGGTPSNEIMNTFIVREKKLSSYYRANSARVRKEFKDDATKAREKVRELYNKYRAGLGSISSSTFAANRLNIIGAYLYPRMISDETTIDDINAYMAENPYATTDVSILKKRKHKEALEKTSAGNMFTDFTIRNSANTEDVKLSDYVGKGNYVLVDFWASWCGPCIGEFPNLRKAHEEFGSKGLIVLGVNVWDKHDKSLEIIEEHKMDWAHIYAPERNATDLYGIKGIPTIILFAPDGTIVDRTIRGQKILDKLQEVYNK